MKNKQFIFITFIIWVLIVLGTFAVLLNMNGFLSGVVTQRSVEADTLSTLEEPSSPSAPVKDTLTTLADAGIKPVEEPVRATDKAAANQEERTQLTLLLSSVNRDIRMLVVDRDGRPVTGVGFICNIRSDSFSASYEDLDKDGILYAADLPSGRYTAELSPTPGYIAPESESTVTVRQEISYTAVADISSMIYMESDIDASVEDTADLDEEDDGELLEAGEIDLSNGTLGIDVSKYNKEIDWETVRDSGVQFAIIRLGYRGSSSGSLVEDPYFQKNLKGAKEAGVKIGVYFFTQALNTTEAVEEASMVASLVKPEELAAPVFIDVEGSGGRGDALDPKTRAENINAFCETLTGMGYRAGVYASKNWFKKYIDTDSLGDWKIWLAQYKVRTPDYEGHYDAWQYSSKGHVDGIEGNVDLNLNLSLGD